MEKPEKVAGPYTGWEVYPVESYRTWFGGIQARGFGMSDTADSRGGCRYVVAGRIRLLSRLLAVRLRLLRLLASSAVASSTSL
jgi:hypothetical protein